MHYTQLTREERYQISALKSAGHIPVEIALILGRHKATISRELRRNKGLRGYRPKQAQELTLGRRKNKQRARLSSSHWARVKELMEEDRSPEQISKWLRREENINISHEWIYHYIFLDKQAGGELYTYLRCQKQRKKRYGSPDRRGQIKERVSIDERPTFVNDRKRVGDWEADTVIGKQGGAVLITLVERRTRHCVITKAADKSAQQVTDAILRGLKPLDFLVKTITYDNGKEFAFHQQVNHELGTKSYFAHPYHSWERGTNENTNGLIRQYYPKGKDLSDITDAEIRAVMDKINNRPRKCLGYKTPNQVLFGINPPVALVT
ncbi:MAG: IS30 family transposase [Desulfuromonas sp.]|nr:IS30 family transposase [Desulfuromonas sp.]